MICKRLSVQDSLISYVLPSILLSILKPLLGLQKTRRHESCWQWWISDLNLNDLWTWWGCDRVGLKMRTVAWMMPLKDTIYSTKLSGDAFQSARGEGQIGPSRVRSRWCWCRPWPCTSHIVDSGVGWSVQVYCMGSSVLGVCREGSGLHFQERWKKLELDMFSISCLKWE